MDNKKSISIIYEKRREIGVYFKQQIQPKKKLNSSCLPTKKTNKGQVVVACFSCFEVGAYSNWEKKCSLNNNIVNRQLVAAKRANITFMKPLNNTTLMKHMLTRQPYTHHTTSLFLFKTNNTCLQGNLTLIILRPSLFITTITPFNI